MNLADIDYRRNPYRDREEPLAEYATLEGIDPNYLRSLTDKPPLRQTLRRLFLGRRPFQEIPKLIETTIADGFDVFLEYLDVLRNNSALPHLFFPWEVWYRAEYSSEEEQTRLTQKQMIIRWIQSFGISHELLVQLADQAPTEKLRNSWLDFNKQYEAYIEKWLLKIPTLFLAQLTKSGLLVSAGQSPHLSTILPFLGLLQGQVEGHSTSTAYDIMNQLRRLPDELKLLLEEHCRLLQRPLASHSLVPEESKVARELLQGTEAMVQQIEHWNNIVSTVLGYLGAQIISADSPTRLAINLLETTITFAITYLVIRESLSKKNDAWANVFNKRQAELTRALADLTKAVRSSSIQSTEALDQMREKIAILREELVEFIQEHNIQVATTKSTYPWYLAIAREFLDKISNIRLLTAGSLINAALIMQAVGPLLLAAQFQYYLETAQAGQEDIQELIKAIKESSLKIPSFEERERLRHELDDQSGGEISKEELEALLPEPIILEALDQEIDGRKVSIDGPISLIPGINFIRAPSGTGKSELLGMIGLSRGNIGQIKLTLGGFDLRRLPYEEWLKMVNYVETLNPNTEMTIGETMAVFLRSEGDNAFKEKVTEIELRKQISESVLDKPKEQLEQLIKSWTEAPQPDDIFTLAFNELMNKIPFNLFSSHQTVQYLLRKPGSNQGTSTGEGERFFILKALLQNWKLLIFDEPTAHLESDEHRPSLVTSYEKITDQITDYVRTHPDAIIVIASNDPRLYETLINEAFGFASVPMQAISNVSKEPELVLWKAKNVFSEQSEKARKDDANDLTKWTTFAR